MDLYRQMGEELRSLFKDLFDPQQVQAVRQKIEGILETASQIGGPLEAEAKLLHDDVMNYLRRPNDHHLVSILKKHALRLEQETREI